MSGAGSAGAEPGAAPSFERALAELEAVVARLESGEVGLEEAVTLFERGQAQLAVCRERLAVAQRRIEELTAEDLPRLRGGDDEERAGPPF